MTAPEILVTTPMRAATSNTVPSYEVPQGACDTHFHVFEPGHPHVPDPLYTFPDATLDQYLALTAHLGISRMVLVQPTFYGTDNTLLLDAVQRAGQERCRAVVRIEEDASDAELDRFHEQGVRALRLDLFSRRDWPLEDLVAYVERMAERAEPRGWHLQFYSPGTVVRDLLPFLATFEHPVVIDHMGYMLAADGLTDADTERMLEVLRGGNCWIKLSGPYRIAKDKPLSSVLELGQALVATRADRLVWGSDWPHLPNGQRDTGELLDLLGQWAPDPQDRKAILVDSPDRLFFAD